MWRKNSGVRDLRQNILFCSATRKKEKRRNRGTMIILCNQGPNVTLNFIREGNPPCSQKEQLRTKLGTGAKAGGRDMAEWMFVYV